MSLIKPSASKMMGYVRLITGIIVIFGSLLFVIEGLASYVLVVHGIIKSHSILAERRHTKYDPDLGWVNEPSINILNMYGPGVYLRTNSQGFRNDHDFNAAVQKGKCRIICSGDSFTLGYGVDNDHTWCQLLTSLDPRLETLNMGQGGYGVDQSYLWYKRDASKFERQVHLLAFITVDFYRMQSDTLFGYGKPVIVIDNGMLVVKNVPVPRGTYDLSWLTFNNQNLGRLRTVEFLKRLSWKIGFAPDNRSQLLEKERNEKTREVLRKIFEDLKRLNKKRSGNLVLVYLPTLYELKGNSPQDPQEWIEFIEKESRALEIPLINLFSEFRSLPYEQLVNMFIPEGQIEYRGAAGHLNNQGNEFVARMIYDELKKYPAICQVSSLQR
jgi:hypothetical protein